MHQSEGHGGQQGRDDKAMTPLQPGLEEPRPRGLFQDVDQQQVHCNAGYLGEEKLHAVDRSG